MNILSGHVAVSSAAWCDVKKMGYVTFINVSQAFNLNGSWPLANFWTTKQMTGRNQYDWSCCLYNGQGCIKLAMWVLPYLICVYSEVPS